MKGFRATWGVCSRTVLFDDPPEILAHWNDIVAVGSWSGQVIILDAVTGIQMSVLYGHIRAVRALTFSMDGTSLVSGSDDLTIKLWDIQTGGAIKTSRVTDFPISVSISMDNVMIACLCQGGRIWLWDTNPEGTCVITKYIYSSTNFSLIHPRLLFVASPTGAVSQWNIDGPEPHGKVSGYSASTVAFSFDGTCLILPEGPTATVLNTDSGVVVAKLQAPGAGADSLWFISPNGKYVACSAGCNIPVWDITGPDPHLVNTFIGHTGIITSISFSSSLISSSADQSVKFWQIAPIPTEPVATDRKLPTLTSFPPMTISLQAKDGVVILVDEAGVVKIWDLSTGLCKASFSTPAVANSKRDIRLIDNRVIFVWCTTEKMHIWDANRRSCHQEMDLIAEFSTTSLGISGDGSKVFVLDYKFIKALLTQTGEVVGRLQLWGAPDYGYFIVDGSKVWVHSSHSKTKGWNFGTSPAFLSDTPPCQYKFHLDLINDARTPRAGSSRIVNGATGKEIFQLPDKFSSPTIAQWDDRYLVAGYEDGGVLILDFDCMIPHVELGDVHQSLTESNMVPIEYPSYHRHMITAISKGRC